MIETWSKEDIDAALPPAALSRIIVAAGTDPEIALDDGTLVRVLEYKVEPPSGLRIVVGVGGLTAAIRYSKPSGVHVTQVFRRSRRIEVIDYVPLAELD